MTKRDTSGLPSGFASARKAESARVEGLLKQDRLYGALKSKNEHAAKELAKGNFANLEDAVVHPTPEWLSKGAVEKFTPKAPDGTVRSVSTVRRVRVMGVARMYAEGKVSMELFFAAFWYKSVFERAGVEGRYKTSNMSGMPTISGGVSDSQHPMAMNRLEADAREAIRGVRAFLGDKNSTLFDAVVLEDLPLRRAAAAAKVSTANILPRFRDICADVIEWCESNGVDLDHFAKNSSGG